MNASPAEGYKDPSPTSGHYDRHKHTLATHLKQLLAFTVWMMQPLLLSTLSCLHLKAGDPLCIHSNSRQLVFLLLYVWCFPTTPRPFILTKPSKCFLSRGVSSELFFWNALIIKYEKQLLHLLLCLHDSFHFLLSLYIVCFNFLKK